MRTILDMNDVAQETLVTDMVEAWIKANPIMDAPGYRGLARSLFYGKLYRAEIERLSDILDDIETALPEDFKPDAEHTVVDCVQALAKTLADYRKARWA